MFLLFKRVRRLHKVSLLAVLFLSAIILHAILEWSIQYGVYKNNTFRKYKSIFWTLAYEWPKLNALKKKKEIDYLQITIYVQNKNTIKNFHIKTDN